jgi:hypothetical protein
VIPILAPLAFTAFLAVTPMAPDSGAAPAHPLRVVTVEGVPPDSLVRADFMAGFEDMLSTPTFAIDARSPGAEGPQGAVRPNRFVLENGDAEAADEEWTLEVVVRAPPPYSVVRSGKGGRRTVAVDPQLRASRGMTVALVVTSPADRDHHVKPAAERFAFAFPQSAAPAQVIEPVPQGFRFPWREAGSVCARLALELLHHRSGDLGPNTHCDLSPAIRTDAVR